MSGPPTHIEIPALRAVEQRLERLERAHDGHQHALSDEPEPGPGLTRLFTESPDQKVGVTEPGGYTDDDFARWHAEALERGFDHNHPRYFLRPHGTALWQEVDEGGYISAEHAAGFYPKGGLGVATGGFGTGAIDGKCVYPPVPPDDPPSLVERDLATAEATLRQADAARVYAEDRAHAAEVALERIKVILSPNTRRDIHAIERAYDVASNALVGRTEGNES